MPLPPAPRKKADLLQANTTTPKSILAAGKKNSTSSMSKILTEPAIEPNEFTQLPKPAASRKPEKKQAPSGNKTDTSELKAESVSAVVSKKKLSAQKLFVLDTNVLMHDPMCLFRFEEHDIFLPMIVLEAREMPAKPVVRLTHWLVSATLTYLQAWTYRQRVTKMWAENCSSKRYR